MNIKRLDYDVYTLLSPIYNNVDIQLESIGNNIAQA